MDLAVIKTGGKQYLVSPGQKIKIEKIDKKEGEEVIFDQVLLIKNGKKIEIGKPLISKAKVIGKVLGQGKKEKIIILKHRPRSSYKIKKGHRQPFTRVEIIKIS